LEKEMAPNLERSLQDVVGKKTYEVWVRMLREIVPNGRTHRLSVILAGMLQYATALAEQLEKEDLDEESVDLSLIKANEGGPDEVKRQLHDVVKRLFQDAGVTFDRVSKRGEPYSIADEAYNEYCSWYDYPWE
jgi:hypothetical protein